MSSAAHQYQAVAHMRWRMLVNGFRSRRGKFEVAARFVTYAVFLLVWGSVSIGLGLLARQFATNGELRLLPLLLWPLLLLWQVVPIMLSSFQDGVDLSLLLRFPVSFRSYSLLYLFAGLFDLSNLVGACGLLGLWIGISAAHLPLATGRPEFVLCAAFALALFAFFNLLLTRMIFAWLDKWLARRKTREILGIFVLFAFLSLQLLNPALYGNSHHGHLSLLTQAMLLQKFERVQQLFPPGFTARSIQAAARGHLVQAFLPLAWLALFIVIVGALLAVRLHAEYRGESLGEAPRTTPIPLNTFPSNPRRREAPQDSQPARTISELSLIRGLFTKELLYLSRSGVMLFSLVAPLFLLFVLGGSSLAGNPLALRYALPLGVAYGFLPLTRQVCNSLGGEGAGIQLYFLSPTPLRTIMLSKNLLQLTLFTVEVALAVIIMNHRFGHPPLQMVVLTFCWLAFALPMELAAGNILSITMAYKMTLTRLSREQGATGNGLISLLVQLLVLGVGVAVYFTLAALHAERFTPLLFVALAAIAVLIYFRVLANVDRLAQKRRETLISTLVRAA